MTLDDTAYQDHFNHVLAQADQPLQDELLRLKMAPYASDPATTLLAGELMVVSMKPYGAPEQVYSYGWVERAAQPGLHRWYDGDRANSNFTREGDRLLRLLIAELALHLRPRQVFNTYAYAYRAADARQLSSFGLEAIDGSTFHREYLAIVQPRIVLCIGNGPAPSAFALYHGFLASSNSRPNAAHPEFC